MVGYSLGADDYVAKPFSNKILLHKVKALLRRVEGPGRTGRCIEHQGVKIDRVRHRVTVDDEALDLTPTEFRLLECLVRQPGRAFSRHQLMDAAIGEGSIVLERTIDVHIKTLRRKLAEAGGSGDADRNGPRRRLSLPRAIGRSQLISHSIERVRRRKRNAPTERSGRFNLHCLERRAVTCPNRQACPEHHHRLLHSA